MVIEGKLKESGREWHTHQSLSTFSTSRAGRRGGPLTCRRRRAGLTEIGNARPSIKVRGRGRRVTQGIVRETRLLMRFEEVRRRGGEEREKERERNV